MKKSLAMLALITGIFISCNNNPDTNNANTEATPMDETAAGNHDSHAGAAVGVTLNNGQKWEANAETTEGITRMGALVATLPAGAKGEDCQALKAKLDQEFDTILQQCTMTGEAHDQLHNYLMPLKDRINKLEPGEAGECQAMAGDLQHYLGEYGNYFK